MKIRNSSALHAGLYSFVAAKFFWLRNYERLVHLSANEM
jgi:hypothetical protein